MTKPAKCMIITGTSRGIGQALARHYLENGWQIAGCSRGDATIKHPCYNHTSLDIAEEKDVARMVRKAFEENGRLDALLNNAGIASMNAALLTPGRSFEAIFKTNAFGAFYCAREAAKAMVAPGTGRIVFFTTVARPLRLEGEIAYASSKAAVESMTQVLARELGSTGITVNAVGPTPVRTDLLAGVPEDKVQSLLHRQSIQRLGEIRDIRNVVDFFLHPDSDFITGQVLYLGGVEG